MQDLLSLFKNADKALQTVFLDNVGKRVRSYTAPTEKTINQIQAFILAMKEYEANPSEANLNKIKDLISPKNPNMNGIKFPNYQNLIFFVPRNRKLVGITIFWRLGSVQLPGQVATYANPVFPLIISDEHEGSNNTHFAAVDIFLDSKAKCMISNAAHPKSSSKPSPCQRSRELSNASHSTGTLFVQSIRTLVNAYPGSVVLNVHGMDEQLSKKILIVNNFSSQFLENGNRSFPLLLSIALAQYNFSERIIAVGSRLPGSVIVKGKTFNLTNKHKPANAFFAQVSGAHNTNVPGHVANGGACNRGDYLDKSAHIEFGPSYRRRHSSARKQFISALRKAMMWLVRYEKAKHNPWNLDVTHPSINANLRLYGSLFGSSPELNVTRMESMMDVITDDSDEAIDLDKSGLDQITEEGGIVGLDNIPDDEDALQALASASALLFSAPVAASQSQVTTRSKRAKLSM